MNPLNKTFFCYDYKHGGRIRKWGRSLDVSESNITVYISTAPLGSKIYQVTKSEFDRWLSQKLIFQKERKPCHIES